MSEKQKKTTLENLYIKQNKSLAEIAQELDTYPNKLRRDAKKFNIQLRDKSQAQKNALTRGVHKHPTKGRARSQDTKHKIGKSVMKSWENLSDEELKHRQETSRARWLSLSQDKQQEIIKLANEAVRKSSKEGSKLEKFLLEKLLTDGYSVDFHKEQILSNTKLQIDLFVPSLNLAIEVDGPSHFENIWGDTALARNTKYDQKKEGLLIGKGINLIRIKQNGDFSAARANLTYEKLYHLINNYDNITFPYIIEY